VEGKQVLCLFSRDCRSIGGTTSRRQAVETGSCSTLSHENSWFMGGTRSMPQAKKGRRPQQQRVELGASIRTIVEKIRARLPRPSCAAAGTSRNIDWKASLGAEWRQYEAIFPALATSRIDQVSVECDLAPIAAWRRWIGRLRSANSSHSTPVPPSPPAGSDRCLGEQARKLQHR
jgi:hypothetical protein